MLLVLAALTTAWLLGVAFSIWHHGEQDFQKRSDCIIVLGAAVQGSQPSPVFEERLRHGIALQQRGLASKILFTGGTGEGQSLSEGEVGERFALSLGVPPQEILKETKSRTTRDNLVEAQDVMRVHGLESAIIVSDPLHLKRASAMAKGLGLEAVTSPTSTTRYRTWKTKTGFLLRELYFVHHYWIFRR